MSDQFIPLGMQTPEEIQAKLEEIEGTERAVSYGLETREVDKRPWLNTQHQYGFIAPFKPGGTKRYHPITSASNMTPTSSLKGKRINIHLAYLRVYKYPTPLISLGANVHTILFNFEARNQVGEGKEEMVSFNQLYKARSGQDAAVTGQPVFIGLTVSPNGVGFSCRTVNVSNSDDEKLVNVFSSQAVTSGLSLLTTSQPAVAPLASIARGLCISLASHSKNVPVQEVNLGLDFETGGLGARLAVGSYVVAQTSRADDIVWKEWAYDAETGTIMRHPDALDRGEQPYPLPCNAFVFRLSRYSK